ncbi:MAG: nitrogenase cofactor biosynthesis protein NifB [Helicobacteraceae bacterium]|jgi:nitrogen fixation protein NifB|nr:nitrogenase cofactor biosynthesis protein NifB [Helicobacteraceae bacterium]
MYAEAMEKINNHPCYSKGAHKYYARIHLSVASACNIQCNYCNRKYDCSNESRPGVTSAKLMPIEAIKKVLYVGGRIKQLSVVGIAGPGDALANPKQTFETLKLVKEHAPDLKLCISTNGLRLAEFADDLNALGVDHITVTINAVDPAIGAQIYPWVYDARSKRRLRGVAAAALLLERQIEGIKKAVANGTLIKANSVLIPNINEAHLPAVSAKLKEMGVFLHNIMPLLSEPRFGTHFALNGVPSATAAQVAKAQALCGLDTAQMTHCRQCRADAVGLLGEDKSAEFGYGDYAPRSLDELKDEYQRANRGESWQAIENFRKHLDKASEDLRALSSDGKTALIAVTSQSGERIDLHFGSCERFDIYEAGDRGYRLYSKRSVASYCSGEDSCGTGPIEGIKAALKGVQLLLTAKIGRCPETQLKSIGLNASDKYAGEPVGKALLSAARDYFGGGEREAEA